MRDTPPEFACKYHDMLASLPIERRVNMVFDMFDTARAFSRAGILMDHPDASEAEIRKEIFLRFYGHELPQPLIERVLRDIDERFAEPAPASA